MALKQLSHREKVIVPAYVCPTVVQSVLKAGLKPVFCDVSSRSLDLDRKSLEQIIDNNLLAVVPAHLYGWAQDIRDLINLGKEHQFFVVEDAAQAFGAKLNGKMVGTWGDAGYFSMGRGKCIPVGHGGVIVARKNCSQAISDVIQLEVARLKSIDLISVPIYLGYGIATHPLTWWLISKTPWNPADAGMDIEELDPIHLGSMSATKAGIGVSILTRMRSIQAVCIQNAGRLIEQLKNFDFVSVPVIHPNAEPVFLRLPIIMEDEKSANRLFTKLSKEGIGVSRSYWRTIPELFANVIPSVEEDFTGATKLAKCLLTLPTHPYLTEKDFEKIAASFQAF
jgi:dTDP-4-amino-4,6-dideoxygalactose transaminase